MTPAEALNALEQALPYSKAGDPERVALIVLHEYVEQAEQESGPACAVCMAVYTRGDDPDVETAVTVSGGTAVCERHFLTDQDRNVVEALLRAGRPLR